MIRPADMLLAPALEAGDFEVVGFGTDLEWSYRGPTAIPPLPGLSARKVPSMLPLTAPRPGFARRRLRGYANRDAKITPEPH